MAKQKPKNPSRLERIKRVAESKKTKIADVVSLPPVLKRATYWLTLRTDGKIDVWLAQPKRAFGTWLASDVSVRILTSDGVKPPYQGIWEKDFAVKEARTIPETNLECIRIGREEPNYV
jgi:hypothetical protein